MLRSRVGLIAEKDFVRVENHNYDEICFTFGLFGGRSVFDLRNLLRKAGVYEERKETLRDLPRQREVEGTERHG
jgi:hypothetical protein